MQNTEKTITHSYTSRTEDIRTVASKPKSKAADAHNKSTHDEGARETCGKNGNPANGRRKQEKRRMHGNAH
eukprot:3078144-Alexandrium_andersonii.AAC.1